MLSHVKIINASFINYRFISKISLTIILLLLIINLFSQTKINFSGYSWIVKESNKEVGPGNNFFSSENIFVNDNNHLELHITKKDNKWLCSEVISENSFGYGKYIFEIEKMPLLLNKNIVLGLFTYDPYIKYHNEIDIEFSRWGRFFLKNSQYVLHNCFYDYPIHRFNSFNLNQTTHIFIWYPDSIVFKSYNYYFEEIKNNQPYSKFVVKNNTVPTPSNEKVHINLWLAGKMNALKKRHKVIIRSFSFIPL